jgi:hypothetical protein
VPLVPPLTRRMTNRGEVQLYCKGYESEPSGESRLTALEVGVPSKGDAIDTIWPPRRVSAMNCRSALLYVIGVPSGGSPRRPSVAVNDPAESSVSPVLSVRRAAATSARTLSTYCGVWTRRI